MSISNILSISIWPILSVVIVLAIMRLKGPRRSKWFALYLGATGIIFLILGVWEFITKQWNDTTNAAIVGIIFILFGATCLLGTHIHIEIYRLKQKLKELENK